MVGPKWKKPDATIRESSRAYVRIGSPEVILGAWNIESISEGE